MENRNILLLNFARRLHERRKQLGKTQAELASEIGVSPRMINAWENQEKQSDPKTSNILALCEALQCNYEFLFGNDPEAPPSGKHKFIHSETGLSYKAIDRLCLLHLLEENDNTIQYINRLLLNPYFATAVQNLGLSANLQANCIRRDSALPAWEDEDSLTASQITTLAEIRKDWLTAINEEIEKDTFGKVVELSPDELARYYYISGKDYITEAIADIYKDMTNESQK